MTARDGSVLADATGLAPDGMGAWDPDALLPDEAMTDPALAVPNLDWLALARSAYSTSQTYFDSSIRKGVVDDIKQSMSQHADGSKYLSDAYRTRSRLYRPKTRATIRKNEATASEAFFSTVDVVSITAEDDGSPVQVASSKLMQQLLQYRLTKSVPWFLTLMGAYQEAQTVGVVCSYQEWQYDERKKPKPIDRPAVKLVPIENLRLDPACDWTDPINSSPYLIEQIPMYVKDVKARMRGDSRGGPRWSSVSDAQLLTAAGRANDVIRQTREGQRTDSKAQTGSINDFTIVWVHRNIMEVDGQDWLYFTLDAQHLLSTPVPLEQVYFHGHRPYVMGLVIPEAHKVYPAGIPRLTHMIAAEINEIANQRIDNVKFAMNKRYFAKRNVQIDIRSLTRNVPGSVTMMLDPEKDVKVVDTPDVTASSYKEQDLLNLDFDDVAGAFSQSSVQSNKNLNETVGGLDIISSSAGQVGNYMLRTFATTWVEPVLRQLVLLEAYYESDETILALAGKNAQLTDKFGINEMTDDLLMQDLIVSVNVGQGATSPQGKLANLVGGFVAMQNVLKDGSLEQRGLKTADMFSEILGIIGYKDSERFFAVDVDPAQQALQKQVTDLQAALDAKYPPDLLAKQVELLAAQIKGQLSTSLMNNVKAAFAAMQAGQVIAQMPGVAPVADEVMKAAGYQNPNPIGEDPNYPTAAGAGNAGAIAATLPPPVDPNADPNADSTSGAPQAGPTDTGAPPGGASTDPLSPALPASPDIGMNRGIETPRSDST